MKKFFKMLAVAAMVACGLMMSGCDEAEDLFGPEDTWCCMPVEYKNSDSSTAATLYVWCYYTDTAKSAGTGAAECKEALPAGLTMVVTAKADLSSVISGLGQNSYIIKSFSKDSDTTGLDETDTSYSFRGSRASWTALYLAKADLRKSGNQVKGVLPQLMNSGNCNPLTWDSIKSEFSWKKLLASYLLS